MPGVRKLQAHSTEAEARGNYKHRVRKPPPREITAHVMGNTYVKFLPVEKMHLSVLIIRLSLHLCRVMQGVN